MNYNIEVDLDVLRSTIQEVDNYIKIQEQKMKEATRIVEEMDWKGTDYERFHNKWTALTNESSIAKRTKQELKEFSKKLSECLDSYQKAQNSLKEIANSLR